MALCFHYILCRKVAVYRSSTDKMPTKCHTPTCDTRDATCAHTKKKKTIFASGFFVFFSSSTFWSCLCVCVFMCFMLSRKINTSSKSINSQSGSKLCTNQYFIHLAEWKSSRITSPCSSFFFNTVCSVCDAGYCCRLPHTTTDIIPFRWFFVRLPSATYCKTCKALPLHVYEVRRPVCVCVCTINVSQHVLVDCTGHVPFVSHSYCFQFLLVFFFSRFIFTRIAVQWLL